MRLRRAIIRASELLSDEDALTVTALYPLWDSAAHYEVGDRIRYNNILYKCLIAHDAQETWTPDTAVSLWAIVHIGIEPWKQPTGSEDAYMIDDKVTHNGSTWISIVNYNIWEPGVYGWDIVNN